MKLPEIMAEIDKLRDSMKKHYEVKPTPEKKKTAVSEKIRQLERVIKEL